MLYEEHKEEKRKKDQEKIHKRMEVVDRQEAEERVADRERKRESRAKKAGPIAIGRGNIPGALSKAPPCYPCFLDSLRHVRISSNMRLSCCTCHRALLFKFTT